MDHDHAHHHDDHAAAHHAAAGPDPQRVLAEQMADAARSLLDALSGHQRAAVQWADVTGPEREHFFYTPTDHGGLPLAEMNGAQQRLTHRLVACGVSYRGYVTMAAIMGLENILDRLEGWGADFNRARGRDPQLYWIALFGDPGSANWGWRFGGHHLSISYTIADGRVASSSPFFFGADPASAPLLGPHLHRPLAGVEDLARELIHALEPQQRRLAIVSPVAPVDLVGVNRSFLTEGDRPLPLPLVFRGPLEGDLLSAMSNAQLGAEAKLGLSEPHLAALAFSRRAKGLSAARFDGAQREVLRALLDVYVERLPDAVADLEQQRYAGERIESLSFLWAGGIEVGQPHYYRVQGADLFVEYDNTQRDVNHIHTVWRDLRNDFGRDALAEHYRFDHGGP